MLTNKKHCTKQVEVFTIKYDYKTTSIGSIWDYKNWKNTQLMNTLLDQENVGVMVLSLILFCNFEVIGLWFTITNLPR